MTATASHTTSTAQPRRQSKAISTPAAVATPLPPRKRSQTGKTCPTKAARPVAATTSSGTPAARAASTTAQPFIASPSSVSRAASLGVPEHQVVKTLIMENERAEPLVVLMHGDRKVSTKELARQAGVKRIAPCKPGVAQRHSGYLIGGTSPFGTRQAM